MRNPRLKRLTAGEQSALSLILSYHKQHGSFPSLRQHAAQADYTHQNASLYRKALVHKEWIKVDASGAIVSVVQPLEGYRTVKAEEATA